MITDSGVVPPPVAPITLTVVKQALHTIGVRSITMACRLALVVMITRTLSTADYGAYSIVSTIGAFGALLCGLNLSTFVYRAVPGKPSIEQLRIFKTAFLFEVSLTLIVATLFLSSGQLTPLLRYLNATAYRNVFVLGLVLVVFLVANSECTTFFQAQARLERSNWVDFLGQAAWIVPLLALRFGGLPVSLRMLLWAQLLGGVAVAIYAAAHIDLASWWRLKPDWSMLRTGLAFSVPLIVPTMGVNSVRLADRLILSHYASVAEVGIYSLAAVFINTLYSFTAGIISATFGPRIFAAHNRGDERQRDRLQTYMLKIAVVGFAVPYLILCVTAKQLFPLVARPDYIRAAGVLPIVGLSSIILIIGYPANYMLTLQNRVVLLATLDVVGMVIGIGANFLLIPRFSYYGAALSGVIALATTATFQYMYSHMLSRLNFRAIFSLREEMALFRQCVARLRQEFSPS
ncbi:MAG TPA: oligosaccharide flippase family protein [Vicinamibacterales bacterium]|nr:oligosaccharide flippase family protein [Vicinamibacterales bacterium]